MSRAAASKRLRHPALRDDAYEAHDDRDDESERGDATHAADDLMELATRIERQLGVIEAVIEAIARL